MTAISVINGPNMNLLGTRKPEVYGRTTLAEVEQMCRDEATELGLDLIFLQSSHEGQIVDWFHDLGPLVKSGKSIGAVYNPGAHTHYSIAIRDAIEGASVPLIETHIANVHAREEFRHHSVMAPIARGIVVGFGVQGYKLALGVCTTSRSCPEGDMKTVDEVRTAVVGAGLIGKRHSEEINAGDVAQLASTVDQSPVARNWHRSVAFRCTEASASGTRSTSRTRSSWPSRARSLCGRRWKVYPGERTWWERFDSSIEPANRQSLHQPDRTSHRRHPRGSGNDLQRP